MINIDGNELLGPLTKEMQGILLRANRLKLIDDPIVYRSQFIELRKVLAEHEGKAIDDEDDFEFSDDNSSFVDFEDLEKDLGDLKKLFNAQSKLVADLSRSNGDLVKRLSELEQSGVSSGGSDDTAKAVGELMEAVSVASQKVTDVEDMVLAVEGEIGVIKDRNNRQDKKLKDAVPGYTATRHEAVSNGKD